MTNLVEQPVYEPGIFQLETQTPALGGPPVLTGLGTPTAGFMNVGPQQLANRTAYLKEQVEDLDSSTTTHYGSNGSSHAAVTTSVNGFMTAADKVKLNGITAGAQPNIATDLAQGTRTATTVPVTSSTGTSATLTAVTTSLAGVMIATDKTKLDGIATGAEVNQNTFQTISVSGQSDVVADTKTDTLTLVAGTSVTITTSAATDTITINSTALPSAGGTLTGQLIGTQSRMGAFIDKYLNNATATGAVGLACGTQSVFNLTLTGATTLSISTMPTFTASSEILTIVVIINQGGTAQTLNWFSGITWRTSGGTAPATPIANKSVEYVFTNIDGTGTAWVGRLGASN